jgi:hypothetical protein
VLFHSPLAGSTSKTKSLAMNIFKCNAINKSLTYGLQLIGEKQDTVFDPISLTCGHIYCYMCACSAASVNVVDGLKTAEATEKCPLCREVRHILHC